MLENAGLSRDAAMNTARKYGPGLASLSLPVLVKVLGKKTVKILLEKIVVYLTYKAIGKEAATLLAKRLFIKYTQKTVARTLSGIGWLLFGVDIVKFVSGPASRMTLNTVCFVSALRCSKRL